MPPLLLADWKEINRAFCAVCWMAALVLAVVILAVVAGTSNVGRVGRSAQSGPAIASSVVAVHPRR